METNKYISKKISVDDLICKLKKALVYEIMAAHEYWISSHIAEGHEAAMVCKRFKKIEEEERHHAHELAKRIEELGGCVSNLDYSVYPKVEFTEKCVSFLLRLNLKGEEEAMDIYYDIIEYTENRDHITYNLINEIFREEADHVRHLKNFLDDIETIKSGSRY